MKELVETAVAMNMPDASSFSFPEDDDSSLTSSSMPMLQQVAGGPEMESTTSGLGTTLKAMQVWIVLPKKTGLVT